MRGFKLCTAQNILMVKVLRCVSTGKQVVSVGWSYFVTTHPLRFIARETWTIDLVLLNGACE